MKIFKNKHYTLVSPSRYTMSAKVVTKYNANGKTFVVFVLDHRSPVKQAKALRLVERRPVEGGK